LHNYLKKKIQEIDATITFSSKIKKSELIQKLKEVQKKRRQSIVSGSIGEYLASLKLEEPYLLNLVRQWRAAENA
jgi:hypothetical protein